MQEETIAHKTARTSIWGGVEKVSTLGISFIVSIVLARLLSPSDYGAIAMLSVFIAIAGQFINCGFGNALIRKPDCTHVDYSTAFYFNLFVSLVCYAILFIAAPGIARFYKMDLLCPVLRVTGLTLPLDALRLVQNAILTKTLKAEKSALIQLCSALISGGISIIMAVKGFGVWSLVAQQLSSGLVCLIILWLASDWYPRLEFSMESLKYLWGFGSKMLLTGIISSTYANIYSIVIGRCYDGGILGVFNRGQRFARLFPEITESVLVKNSLPILSQLQNDKERLIHVYREFIKLACFIVFPAVCLTALLAEPFVRLVLTEKWMDSVIYIQIFAVTALFYPANSINLNLLQTYGRSDYTLKAEVIKKSIGLATVFLLLPLGPKWLAIGACVMDVLALSVNAFFAKKLSGLSYKLQLLDIFPVIVCTMVTAICVFLLCQMIQGDLVKLLAGGILGLIIYFIMTKYIFQMDIYEKIFSLVK